LRHDPLDRRGDEEGLDVHVDEAQQSAHGILRVERREDLVPREGRLHGHAAREVVAHLSENDHVGVLPDDRPQRLFVGEADLVVDLALGDAVDLVLDRVLGGDDLGVDVVERGNRRREGGRLPAARRPGQDDDSRLALEDVLGVAPEHQGREPELLDAEHTVAPAQDAQDRRLAVDRDVERDADVELMLLVRQDHAPVLVPAALRDVGLREHLDPADEGRMDALRKLEAANQDAVHAKADTHAVRQRLDVDVARALAVGRLDEVVQEVDDLLLTGRGVAGGAVRDFDGGQHRIDLARRNEHELNVAAEERLDHAPHLLVPRIRDGDANRLALPPPEREHLELLRLGGRLVL
jgi:hypothetical protein